jgi:L-lactate utilization protein LutB
MNAEVVPRLAAALASRGVSLVYARDGREALSYLLQRIPPGARVMNGGSATLEQIGFLEVLRDGRYDWLVGGVNAITLGGEIVNVDGSGNRLAGYAFGAGKVILVAGLNKIVPDLTAAIERIRNTAAVQECRKLTLHTPCAVTGRCDNDACRGPERQCGKILIIENEKIADRITVLLVGGWSFGY